MATLSENPRWIEQAIARLERHLTDRRRERMTRVLATRSNHVIFVFERMVDPHNLSAVLRTMDAFSFQEAHWVLPEEKLGLSRGVSIGADRWLSLSTHDTTEACFTHLRERGYSILASHVAEESGGALDRLDFSQPLALVFGNEHAGVSEETLALADGVFHIPMLGFVESFNLSVAAAITASRARSEMNRLMPADPAPERFLLDEAQNRAVYLQWLRYSVRRAETILEELKADFPEGT